MRHRILVVGREARLRARLARLLSDASYIVDIAESSAHARRMELKGVALSIVIRTGLGPDRDGLLDVLRTATGGTILVAESSRSLVDPASDILDASDEAGLLARISNALKEPAEKLDERAQLLSFADYYLDLAGQALFKKTGQEIALTWGEYRLLRSFVQRPGRVLSRDHLLQSLSGQNAEAYDRSIDMQVVRLRRKIEPDAKRPSLIIAIRGSGYKFAAQVKEVEATIGSVPDVDGPPDPSPASAERRQVTALCSELLTGNGSGTAGDPEELQSIIVSYRQQVTAVVAQHGGTVGHCVAGEVLAYFGHPVAQEHAAERAIHAALVLAEGLVGMDGNDLSIRAGLATGLVVVDPAGEVIGDAPGDAARMRSLAEPGQVIVTATTRQASGQLFTYHALGPVTLKSVLGPMTAWRVLGPSALSRSEALYDGKSLPLVGRVEERTLLRHAWQQARSGEGRVVLLTGEPGIGKSRLLVELERRLVSERHSGLRYFCSPQHEASALHPIIVRWEQEACFQRDDTAEQRLGKLESILAPDGFSPTEIGLLAGMLGIPVGERYSQPDLSPQRRREVLFAVLQRRLACLAQRQPVLMLFEDIQWIDHSSLELLDMLVSQITEHAVLLVISFRPEFSPSWIGRAGVGLITLTRLDRRQSTALAVQVAEGRTLSSVVVERIIAQTDGVPLFIEEMTKAILETASDGAFPGFPVPSTLQALLMARLDRLGLAAKDIAQTGAAIGREFRFDLLAFVSDLPEPQLCEALDRLVNSGLLFVRGEAPRSSYVFKHALVQDAAYGALVRSRRQHLHTRIAVSLEDRFPEIVLGQPALLAQHCAEAGLSERAAVYWSKAGEQALARSAMTEAVAQLRKGLDALASLPDGPSRQHQELDLQSFLCSALCATKGLAAVEVGDTLARARVLAEQLDRAEYLAPLLDGQWGFHCVRAEHGLALSLAGLIEKIGVARNDVSTQLLGRFNLGIGHFVLGEFVAARALLEQCLGLGDPALRRIGESLHSDQYPITLAQLALTLVHLGYIDQARLRMREALSEVRGHAHTLANVLNFVNWIHWLTRSPELLRHAEELQTVSTNEHFPLWLGWAFAYRGRSLTSSQAAEGFALLSHGLAAVRATGAVVQTPLLLMWLAEAHSVLGRSGEGLQCLVEAMQIIETTGERCTETEVLRLHGDLLIATGDGDAAERHYRQAIAVAEQQSAKLFQLRASTSLARLWRDRGKRAEPRDLLGPIYDWFTEGFDAADLKDARALLDELA